MPKSLMFSGRRWDERLSAFGRVIGEAARGDMRAKSDLDFLAATESDVGRLRDCQYYPIKFALDEGREVWSAS